MVKEGAQGLRCLAHFFNAGPDGQRPIILKRASFIGPIYVDPSVLESRL